MKNFKFLILTMVLLVAAPGSGFSECYTSGATLFFTDLETLLNTERVLVVSPAQGLSLVQRHIQDGKVISVGKGIRVKKIEQINEHLVVVESSHYPYITFSNSIECD
jgi:hypothetical protein